MSKYHDDIYDDITKKLNNGETITPSTVLILWDCLIKDGRSDAIYLLLKRVLPLIEWTPGKFDTEFARIRKEFKNCTGLKYSVFDKVWKEVSKPTPEVDKLAGLDVFLDRNQVYSLTGLSESRLKNLIFKAEFPQGTIISPRRLAWRKSQVIAWMNSKIPENL